MGSLRSSSDDELSSELREVDTREKFRADSVVIAGDRMTGTSPKMRFSFKSSASAYTHKHKNCY